MSINKKLHMLTTYSVAHFTVDFACAFLMFRYISAQPDWYLYMLVYNFCAFALQMPLGIIADRISKNCMVAITGCALTALSFGLHNYPFAAVVAAGVGNGMFHIGGGIDILNISGRKAAYLGIFVSPGAFGIYLGTILGRGTAALAMPTVLTLVIIGALILVPVLRMKRSSVYPENAEFALTGSEHPENNGCALPSIAYQRNAGFTCTGNEYAEIIHSAPASCAYPKCAGRATKGSVSALPIAAACFFLVVFLRSYAGLSVDFPWRSIGHWGTAAVFAVVFGKTAGGLVSDRFGAAKTAFMSLGLAALLFIFPHIPASGAAALFLFNMTMPITLWAMASVFPGAKGFSFGILSFALFLGFLPGYFDITLPNSFLHLMPAAAIISLALLRAGLRKAI